MELYHINHPQLENRFVINGNKTEVYCYRDRAGLLISPRKVPADGKSMTITYNKKRVTFNMSKLEVDYSNKFDYGKVDGHFDKMPHCDWYAVQQWLKENDAMQLPFPFNRYAVSKKGVVYKILTKYGLLQPKILLTSKNTEGYHQIALSGTGNVRKYVLLHRLVAYTFLGLEWNSKLDVDHIDMDKDNNSLENVRACTRTENLKYFRERVVKSYFKNARDISKTARAMNMTKHKVIESLKYEGVLPRS
jgi:hypothetical protein